MLKVYYSNILNILIENKKKPFYSVSYKTLIILIFLSIQPQYSWAGTKETLSSMKWQSCGNSAFQMWFNDPPPSELLCGYVNVPLRYNSESSATHPENKDIIRLAATLLPARGKREGALITVTGGPGIPGINPNLSNEWPVSRLREMWDIIGYDPRGVGQSIPKIKCTLNRSSPGAESSILISENWAKDKVKSCLENTGAQFLQHIGTDEAVNDLDRIRQAMGELRLTAISWSYGTKVAATYAERFPEKVRALVLDGVVNLAEDDYTQRLNQSRAYQHSFNRFTTWCSRNGSCPLPPNNNKALVYYWDLLNRLNRHPLIAKDYGQITASDLLALTGASLLWSSEWPILATAIRQLDAGIISEEIVLAMKRIKQVGDEDALNVITCADTARPFTDKKILYAQHQKIGRSIAYANYKKLYTYPLDMCDFWPWEGKDQPHTSFRHEELPALLFVAQRFDPTTPWLNAEIMSKAFRSPLITLEGDGHTVALSGSNICVDKRVTDYIISPDSIKDSETCY